MKNNTNSTMSNIVKISTFIINLLFLSVSFNSYAERNEALLSQKINTINSYYDLNKQDIAHEKLLKDLAFIHQKGDKLPSESLGKAYLLLANAAHYLGDDSQAAELALKGVRLNLKESSLTLNLHLALMRAYLELGKYERIISLSDEADSLIARETYGFIDYQLYILSYRAITHAKWGKRELSSQYLADAEILMVNNPSLVNNVALFEMIAMSYQALGEFDISSQLFEKSLKRRFDTNNKLNIERVYFQLALAYLNLNKLEDALNVIEEVNKYAKRKNSKVLIAKAQLRKANLAFYKGNKAEAKLLLLSSVKILKQYKVTPLHFSGALLLAKISYEIGDIESFKKWLLDAYRSFDEKIISEEQSMLYELLALQAKVNDEFKQALNYMERYTSIHHVLHRKYSGGESYGLLPTKTHSQRVVEMSEINDVKDSFNLQLKKQRQTIFLLAITTCLFIVLSFIVLLKKRRLTTAYRSNHNKLTDYIEPPIDTKQTYQLHYKMARKFNYTLSTGYLVIENWKELTFHFNAKTLKEVKKKIAILLNESISDFEYVGTINDGEYIVLCPHQALADVERKLQRIANAIDESYFANLGGYSVKIKYRCDEPKVKDIDPYIFLSQLSDKGAADAV